MARTKWALEVDAPGKPYADGQKYYLDERGNYVSIHEAHRFSTKKDAEVAGEAWGMGEYKTRRLPWKDMYD